MKIEANDVFEAIARSKKNAEEIEATTEMFAAFQEGYTTALEHLRQSVALLDEAAKLKDKIMKGEL